MCRRTIWVSRRAPAVASGVMPLDGRRVPAATAGHRRRALDVIARLEALGAPVTRADPHARQPAHPPAAAADSGVCPAAWSTAVSGGRWSPSRRRSDRRARRPVARGANQSTSLGAWLDPAADKLLLVTTFVVLTLPNLGPAEPHAALADGPRHQPRHRHRPHGGHRQPGVGPRTFRPSPWARPRRRSSS